MLSRIGVLILKKEWPIDNEGIPEAQRTFDRRSTVRIIFLIRYINLKNYFPHQQQTAPAALNAYSSAAAIPVVGYIIAPIAAAMAVAAGAMQVAAIKKQQQASQAQGYGEGGFTRKGRADEVAGVVHAGEWVASQKLVASPVARPLIEALDYAQRTNTIGSLRSTDVSRSITAPMALAQSQLQVIVQESKDLKEIIARLNERLDEPFVTVNTVTGDKGIKTCASRMQTSSLDLLRRRQVYPTRRRTSTSASWTINHRNLRENEVFSEFFANFAADTLFISAWID